MPAPALKLRDGLESKSHVCILEDDDPECSGEKLFSRACAKLRPAMPQPIMATRLIGRGSATFFRDKKVRSKDSPKRNGKVKAANTTEIKRKTCAKADLMAYAKNEEVRIINPPLWYYG